MILESMAMSGLVGVIIGKFVTAKNVQSLKRMVANTQVGNNKVKAVLRLAESTRAAAMHDLNKEERVLKTLRLKFDKYEKELASLKK